ncbi:MAG TPA: double zinc ribbon domain-containing protein [Gemmatimonadales bacterium]|nr:double zinc ribbon domain-containing protein [Gemmatimonadales bacterium]
MLRSADPTPPTVTQLTPAPTQSRWRTVLRGVEQWLLPAECLLCHSPVPAREHDALVCGLCRARWRPLPEPLCMRCGAPVAPADGSARVTAESAATSCRICADWPPVLARVRSAVRLEGGARDVVHHLKYQGWWRAAGAMALAMRHLEPLTGQLCLIPVPLAPRRERDRGYNQSERLAAALGALVGQSVRTDLLRRVRETSTQTALTPEERRANVVGAFEAAAGVARVARGQTFVVVDDVFTTGATLLAAAEALASAGATRVEGVTFGRAAG